MAKQVFEEKGAKVDYLVGTMIEIPRAAVTADEIAETAQFFSFGTNDLTQTGLGMSRDDSGSFLPQYQELEIIKKNVFASIDQEGIGKLMKIAVELGRSTRPGGSSEPRAFVETGRDGLKGLDGRSGPNIK